MLVLATRRLFSTRNDPQRAVEGAEHTLELLAAAHDVTRCGDHAVSTLSAPKPWVLLDPINREFAGAAENRKYRAIFEEIDGVITPFAGSDLAAIETENAIKLTPAEGNLACGGGRSKLAPAPRARFDFAECHAAPPLSLKFHCRFMIAPDGCAGKGFAAGRRRSAKARVERALRHF
jgi:hypothetical protein